MRIKKICTVSKDFLFVLICLLAFFRPEYLLRIPGVSLFFNIYRIISVSLISFKFMTCQQRKTQFFIVWMVIEVWIVTTTFFHNGDISYAFYQMLTILSIAALFEIYKDKVVVIYKAIFMILSIYICINFITLILYPNGMYSTGVIGETTANWFLGFKNKHIVYYLPFVCVTLVLGKIEGYNLKKIVMLVVVASSALYINSSTSLICFAVILIVSFIPYIRKKYRIFNMYSYFGVAIIMFVAIPVFRLQYLFKYFIENILKKDVGLTYRTDLWNRAFQAISEHPIVGWGEQTNEIKHKLYNSSSIISAHNQILEYIYVGGIILLLLYIIANLMLAKHVYKYRDKEVAQIISGIYLALQIALIAEVYTDVSIYMIYFLIWHIDAICKMENFSVINRIGVKKIRIRK